MSQDFKELPKISDSISYIYVEYARIEQDNYALKLVRENSSVLLPITNFLVMFLGPGTSITHQAIKVYAELGVLVIWCGQNLNYFYASGFGRTRSSKNMLMQIDFYKDNELHLQVVRKMYELRFKNISLEDKNLNQMRGLEGSRVKSMYKTYSKLFNVPWTYRDYKVGDIEKSDMINQAITYSNNILYGLCKAIILIMGFNVSIGFIHTGNIFSFVYDIADLYKMETSVLASFKTVGYLRQRNIKNLDYNLLRNEIYKTYSELKLLQKIPKDLKYLFGSISNIEETSCGLWDNFSEVSQGKNYAGDIE